MSKLNGYKTYIVALVTILYALVGMWSGSLDQATGMQMILGALGLGAVRHGIATSVKPALALCLAVGALALSACARVPAVPPAVTPIAAAPAAPAAPAAAADPLAGLRSFTLADLQAASADAKAQIPPDDTAIPCYDFLAASLPAVPGFQPGQTVGAIMAFQKARDLVNGTTAQSGFLKRLNLACAPLVNDVNLTLAKLGVLAGGIAATGGALAPVAAGLPAIGAALPIPLAVP